jgi:hypothetical protein
VAFTAGPQIGAPQGLSVFFAEYLCIEPFPGCSELAMILNALASKLMPPLKPNIWFKTH